MLTVNKFVWYCCLSFGFKMNLKQGILLYVIFPLLAFSANGIEGRIKWKYCWLLGPKLTWGKTWQLPFDFCLQPSAPESCLVLFWSLATGLIIYFLLDISQQWTHCAADEVCIITFTFTKNVLICNMNTGLRKHLILDWNPRQDQCRLVVLLFRFLRGQN